jgi:hypothetical protein
MEKIFLLYIILIILFIFNYFTKYSFVLNSNYIQSKYILINNIPNNVYLTWSSLNAPINMYSTVLNNINNNPDFNFYIYDDNACIDFINKHFDSDVLYVYKNLKPGAYKADLFRYCVLYIYGGVYMDIKFILHKKLKDLILKYNYIFVSDLQTDKTCKGGCFNGFMISPKNNNIFIDCIKQIVVNYKNNYYGLNSLYPTGPCLLGNIIQTNYPFINYKLQIISKLSGYTINDEENNIIISQYLQYRFDLYFFSKTKHYSELWNNNDIYNYSDL